MRTFVKTDESYAEFIPNPQRQTALKGGKPNVTCDSLSTMPKQIIYTDQAPAPIGPYSQAVKIGDTLYVSGQIAAELAPAGDIRAETRQVMENVGAILRAADMDYTNVVKASIFVKDLNNFGAINEVYGSFFTADYPARETVEVARLPKDVNVEISVIAV